MTAPEAIEQLLSAQIQLRNNRRLQAAMRSSRLPAVKQLHDFDFTFQPSLRREQIESLHELGFVERRENVIFLGPPGVGKTHLAISLAIAAAQSGRRVYYGTLADLGTVPRRVSMHEAVRGATLRGDVRGRCVPRTVGLSAGIIQAGAAASRAWESDALWFRDQFPYATGDVFVGVSAASAMVMIVCAAGGVWLRHRRAPESV